MNILVNIIGAVTALGALVLGAIEGDLTYTSVGIGVLVFVKVIGIENKLAKIEKETAK